MSCQRFREKLSAHIDGELDFETRTELEKHLLECKDCSRQLDEMRRIESFKPLLEPPVVSQDKWRQCWEGIRKQTTDSLEAEKVKGSVARRRRLHLMRRAVLGLAGIAAAVAVAAVLLWPSAPQPEPAPLPMEETVCVYDYDDANYNLYIIDNSEYTIIKLIPVNAREGG